MEQGTARGPTWERKQREAPRHPSEVEMEQGHLDADSTITFDGPINHHTN